MKTPKQTKASRERSTTAEKERTKAVAPGAELAKCLVLGPEPGKSAVRGQQEYDRVNSTSFGRLKELYPDATAKDSAFSRLLWQEVDACQRASAPLLLVPNWPELLAYKVGAAMGILPVGVAVDKRHTRN